MFKYCRDRDFVPFATKSMTLQALYAAVVGRHLPKPQNVRVGDWSNLLSDECQAYALLDAFAPLDIYTRVQTRQAYGQSLEGTDFPAGTEIAIRLKRSRHAKAIGVLLDTPPVGTRLMLKYPPRESGQPCPTYPQTVRSYHRMVSIQRIDEPTWKLPGYFPDSSHIEATMDNPFEALLPVNYLFTRPPLENRQTLPPSDAIILEVIEEDDAPSQDETGAAATDAAYRDLESEAQDQADDEEASDLDDLDPALAHLEMDDTGIAPAREFALSTAIAKLSLSKGSGSQRRDRGPFIPSRK